MRNCSQDNHRYFLLLLLFYVASVVCVVVSSSAPTPPQWPQQWTAGFVYTDNITNAFNSSGQVYFSYVLQQERIDGSNFEVEPYYYYTQYMDYTRHLTHFVVSAYLNGGWTPPECVAYPLPISMLDPNWLSNATYQGVVTLVSSEGSKQLCNYWTIELQGVFYQYYAEVETNTPVKIIENGAAYAFADWTEGFQNPNLFLLPSLCDKSTSTNLIDVANTKIEVLEAVIQGHLRRHYNRKY
eukprot:GEZU01011930.1.p1 GENE.GEZU01011930.1~~GEZU01011930.1.p1  ORF type:complete len:240 (-),score=25.48 GEZU01011930.1:95-814(-)